ncbi:MAG: ATP-binding protein [Bacteroidales bacterium]|nr:ATP-binding protein [Bacteroidales bacterium]
MKYNKFYISIFSRIILIVFTCFLFVYFIERDDNILTAIFVVFLVLVQIIFLIKYVNRTNRELAEFLLHLQQGDTSVVFSKENIEKTFKGLRGSFEKINIDLKKIRSEKEQKEHYLNYVIDNVKTGLLAFNETGVIEFVNRQAKVFLNKKDCTLLNINSLDAEYVKILNNTKLSESTVIKKTINDDFYFLAFSFSEFKIENKKIKLFAIHDVKQEIETNEIESWQKLIRVLTHEMMNSITPITSLAHAIKRYLKNDDEILDQQEISNELISDIVENAEIIENRSKGLLEFIDNYRTITKLPKPKFEAILVKDLIEKMVLLFEKEITTKQIAIIINVDSDNLELHADKGMIEQVIINLIKNSIEALNEVIDPSIVINIFTDDKQKLKITISDNGKGIEKEKMDDVFIPFYTTKENGTGVGLSLSRQIMRLHKGSIIISSDPKVQTKVGLTF